MSAGIVKQAAVLGLGIIGSRVFKRLVDAGWQVSCWNRTPKGLTGEAESPESAIRDAAVVSIYLKDVPAVREVFSRIAPALKPGQIVLNHATLDLETTKWLEANCQERGCRFLDAPFTGSKEASAGGQLFYYTGGDIGLAAELDSYFAIIGRGRLHCGEVGTATVLKLATNLISACTVQAMAEALAIATHHGVSADSLVQAVAENASGSKLAAMKFPLMVEGNYEPHFSLANMGKDSRYMLSLADSAGLKIPALKAVSQRMDELCHEGLGAFDFAVLAKPYLKGN
jgi:3-hydroxyisobutyrate dehydrogenase-like beta-hydroxyacid dehydrogenase